MSNRKNKKVAIILTVILMLFLAMAFTLNFFSTFSPGQTYLFKGVELSCKASPHFGWKQVYDDSTSLNYITNVSSSDCNINNVDIKFCVSRNLAKKCTLNTTDNSYFLQDYSPNCATDYVFDPEANTKYLSNVTNICFLEPKNVTGFVNTSITIGDQLILGIKQEVQPQTTYEGTVISCSIKNVDLNKTDSIIYKFSVDKKIAVPNNNFILGFGFENGASVVIPDGTTGKIDEINKDFIIEYIKVSNYWQAKVTSDYAGFVTTSKVAIVDAEDSLPGFQMNFPNVPNSQMNADIQVIFSDIKVVKNTDTIIQNTTDTTTQSQSTTNSTPPLVNNTNITLAKNLTEPSIINRSCASGGFFTVVNPTNDVQCANQKLLCEETNGTFTDKCVCKDNIEFDFTNGCVEKSNIFLSWYMISLYIIVVGVFIYIFMKRK